MNKKKVHLVLGSGGARGVAHIGVIEMLEETGHEIVSIAGCSMGAVVGGIYAAGFQQTYKEWMLLLTKPSLFKLMDFTLARQGFLKGERIFTIFQEVMGPLAIEQLKIPFTAVAADMSANREVHYRSGDLYKALRASIAIPGVFTPVLENGQFLVDGGVLNPLPLNLIDKKEGEWTIAVNLNGAAALTPAPVEESDQSVKTIWERLMSLEEVKEYNQKDFLSTSAYSLRELMLATYSMTQNRLTALMLQIYPPDILIEIPKNTCHTFEFHKAKTLIEIGRNACRQALSLNSFAVE